MNVIFAGFLLLCADPTVKLPSELKARPGRLLKIEATSSEKMIRWVNVSEDADLIVSESGRWAIFSATTPGNYRVFAWTASGDVPSEASICTVIVEGAIPGPPVPPPQPEDPLKTTLKAIYGADSSADKARSKSLLVDCYQQFAKSAQAGGFTTLGQFYSACRQASQKVIPEDALRPVREKIAEELDKNLPTDPEAAFNLETRNSAARLFSRYAQILSEIQ